MKSNSIIGNPKSETRNPKPWIVRSYKEGDEKQAYPLFNKIFNKSISEAHYCWKVIDTPWPVGTATTWFADADGLIVGQYASTAMRIWLQGKTVPIVHVCDVMTHPDFRRQGILSAVGEMAHKTWQEKGVVLVTGFPHKGWGSRSKYLNWQTMYHSGWMWQPLRPGQLLKERTKLPGFLIKLADGFGRLYLQFRQRLFDTPLNNISINSIEKPGEDFDRLWERLKHEYETLVVRDCAWIQYRYFDAPEGNYDVLLATRDNEPVGYLAYHLRQLNNATVAYIADLFTAPDDTEARNALIQSAKKKTYEFGAKAILAVVPPISSLQKIFSRNGFFSRYGKFDVSIVPLAEDLPIDAFRDPNRWFSMGGDFDII